jgi:hypothetical protein
MCREAVTKGVASGGLLNSGSDYSSLHRTLKVFGVSMVPHWLG